MPEMDNPRMMKYISNDASSPDDKLLQLETKLSRLIFGFITLTFCFVGLLVAGAMVQIFFNSRPCCMSPTVPEEKQEDSFASTSLDAGAEQCCDRLRRAVETLQSDLSGTLQQEQFQNEDIRKIKETLAKLESEIRTSARLAPITVRTSFEAEKERVSGGEAAVTHVHLPIQMEPTEEKISSAREFIFQSGDDEDDLGSGCPEFARPVCPGDCLEYVLHDGCPVPVCCIHSVVQPRSSAQQGHHHHH